MMDEHEKDSNFDQPISSQVHLHQDAGSIPGTAVADLGYLRAALCALA